jgi:hypothetical protein
MDQSVREPIVGSVVLATDQGLGILAKSFYDSGVIKRVLIEVMPKRTSHFEWYPGAKTYTPENIEGFLDGLDVLLIFEKLADWTVMERAREKGIRIVLMPMYEITPESLPIEPDHYLAPSALELEKYKNKARVDLISVPVEVPWRLRSRARVFVHNSGTCWSFFRNGTFELLESLPMIKSSAKLIIRMLRPLRASDFRRHARKSDIPRALELLDAAQRDPRVELVIGVEPWESLWREGDVFVFPEKYNGLSLPLQEAYASGMLVMAADRHPVNTWLPKDPLIPVAEYRWGEDFGIPIRHAIVKAEQIAANIDQWYDEEIEALSLQGKEWALENSWEQMRQPYLDILAG